VWRYWDADPERRVEYATEEEYVEDFFEVFAESVRCRMRSARPVGIFLSGGMDSGSVASVAGRLMRGGGGGLPPEFRSYSWAFEELADSDERHISGGIASRYGFPAVDVPADDMWPMRDYPAHGPDPDSPLIWVYQPLHERTLSMARSDGVALMMAGDRGDEMVGDWAFDHLGLLRAGRLGEMRGELTAHGRLSGASRKATAINYLLKPALEELWPRGMGFAHRARRGLRGDAPPVAYPDWVRPEFAGRIGLDDIIHESEPRTSVRGHARKIRYGRIFSYAIARLVSLNERTWSRFGVGFADPWSDRRLAELILAMPQWRVQRVREPKRIARLAMRGVMPDQTLRKTSKIEPIALFDCGFKDRARDTVLDLTTNSQAAARGYLDEDAFRAHYEAFLRGEPSSDFWWAITLEMWLRQHWS
jgi:asparagine synthase (glutamine-hydrolysing)